MSVRVLSLTERLAAFQASMLDRIDPAVAVEIKRAEAALIASGALDRALKPGDMAPDFALPNYCGRTVSLHERLADGPVALTFVRGGWCPFCSMTLRAWQDALPALKRAGGSLIAITPQPPAGCTDTAERNMMGFPLLSDHNSEIASAYGVDIELPEGLRGFYLKLGHDLPRVNGSGNWRLPLPASFVIGKDGRIADTFVAASKHIRMEPERAIATVRSLA